MPPSSSSSTRPTDSRNANDLAVLEATILMSMEEHNGAAAQASGFSNNTNTTDYPDEFHDRLLAATVRRTSTTYPYHFSSPSDRMRMTEEEQIAMAIAASLQETNIQEQRDVSTRSTTSDDNNDDHGLQS